MKKFLLIVLAMGLIFGVTFITQFTGTETKSTNEVVDPAEKERLQAETMPLFFTSAIAKYDPNSSNLLDRYFKGFYEKGDDKGRAYYWFMNPHSIPTTLQFGGFSCAICTKADVAVIPRKTLAEALALSALPVVPGGLCPVPTLLPVVACTKISESFQWQGIGREEADLVVNIPEAASKAEPTIGVLRIAFKATDYGPRNPSAAFIGGVKGSTKTVSYPFGVSFICVDSFEVFPSSVSVGEMPEGGEPFKFDIYYWSQVRDQKTLSLPTIQPNITNDPLIKIGTPVKFTEQEYEAFSAKLASVRKDIPKMLVAYKIPVTVLREAPGQSPDIGPFEKHLTVVGPSEQHPKISIRGKVTGVISLEEGEAIDLKTYDGRFGTTTKANVISTRADIELETVPTETKPGFLQVALENPTLDGGQKKWGIKITVPPNQGFQSNWEGVITLQTKGPNSLRVRIPVKGNGTIKGR